MFSFLNSGILILAVTAIIPLLIYLFIVKKPIRVIFSSIRNIKLSQKKQKNKIKLKNILLLIIRTLIILLTILAIARPAIKSPLLHKWSKHSQTAVAIILDTSYSMEYLVDTKTELEYGKELIQEINEILSDRDIVTIFTSDENWNRIHSILYYNKIPESVLASIEISARPVSLKELTKEAALKLKESHIPNREIHIISDMRKQELPDTNEAGEIPILFLPTSDLQERANISVQNARVVEDFVDRKLERKIEFDLVNHSDMNQSSVICQLFVNGRTISEKVLDLNPRQRRKDGFVVPVDEYGWYSGYVSVRNERLEFDNKSYFAFFNNTEAKVAVISDKRALSLPLISILEIYVGDNIDIFSGDNINYETLSAYEFVIIDSESNLSPRIKFLIDRLINDRKGVLHLAKENITAGWKDYYQEKFGLSFNTFETTTPHRITNINQFHPVFSIFNKEDFSTVEVRSFWQSRIRGSADVLLQAGNLPLAVENNRELVWLFDIERVDNRLFLEPIYPIMAFRTFLYLSYSDSPYYQVGDRIFVPSGSVSLPGGGETTVEQYLLLSRPGVYRSGSEQFVANIDYTPSDYERMTEIEILDGDWKDEILRNRSGFEIWKILLVLVLLLVLTEMLVVKIEEKK